MATVELRNLIKHYPGNPEPTVRGVDLQIQDREFVVLVGPSGCGKSTVLRMIAGLESITSGDLLIDGVRVNDLPPKARNIGMVFQNYALFPHLTVRGNLAFGMRVRGLPKQQQEEAIAMAARILGLEPLLERKPSQLSGGQSQRVAVGRALVRQPAVFLFDEPLSNLDAKLRAQMRVEIIKLHRQLATTMVYVTHDQVEAMTMSDRIVVFSEGLVQQVGTPREIYEHPANRFVAGFLGSLPMNLVEGRIEGDGAARRFRSGKLGSSRGSTGDLQVPLGGHPRLDGDRTGDAIGQEAGGVTLGVRPENVYPANALPATVRASPAVSAEVEIVEYFGSESSLTVRAGGDTLVMLAKDLPARPGDRLEIAFDLDRLHLFSASTQRAVYRDRGAPS